MNKLIVSMIYIILSTNCLLSQNFKFTHFNFRNLETTVNSNNSNKFVSTARKGNNYLPLLCSFGNNGKFDTLVTHNSWIQEILNSKGKHSCFIVLGVNSLDYNGKIVIEYSELHLLMNKEHKISYEEYSQLIANALSTNSKLNLGYIPLKEFRCSENSDVDDIYQKGKDYFLSYYFNKNILKKKINNNQRKSIIAKLFELKLICSIDDESGVLIIRN